VEFEQNWWTFACQDSEDGKVKKMVENGIFKLPVLDQLPMALRTSHQWRI